MIEFYVAALLVFASVPLIVIRRNLRAYGSMAFFVIALLNTIFLYFQTHSYFVIGLTVVCVSGFVYSVENLSSKKILVQTTLSDYAVRDSKKEVRQTLKVAEPKVELYHEEKPAAQLLIASRTSGKFHLPGCRYAKRIMESNSHVFSSVSDAEKAGYRKCVCVE